MGDSHRKPHPLPVYNIVFFTSLLLCLCLSFSLSPSSPFKQKMNQLLISLLKLDPLERMTYPEFFDFVDDLIKSKVEVVNLLHGTAFKFMVESDMK